MIIWIFINIFCFKNEYIHAGPVSSRLHGIAYLPPLPESTPDHASFNKSLLVDPKQILKNTNSYTTSFKINHNSEDSVEKRPFLKAESSYSRTYHDSYAPQPSGIGKNGFSPPTSLPLPPLIPNTVFKQLKSTSSTTFPSPISNNQENVFSAPLPIIMVDSSTEILTPSKNQTIVAAKLLASSLLEETANSSLSKFHGFNNLELNDVKNLDSNDMYIVRAQKNAYIIPSNFNTMDVQELYSMRNNLDKAYTINQFIFIVKPEHINFLNKLV